MTSASTRPKRPTLRMVAEAAGVSTATASYVLSGRARGATGVSVRTSARVRDAATRLGYHPDPAARAMRTGRTDQVLLSLTMLADPWSQAVAAAVSQALRPHGVTTLTLADDDWATVLERQPCDAVFIDAVDAGGRTEAEATERLKALAARGHRLVVFSETVEPDGFDVVRSVATGACHTAVEHLAADHTRIGCLTASRRRRKGGRYSAYLQTMAAAGLEVRSDDVETYGRDAISAFAAATTLLERDDRPTAVYATTDFAAIATISAAHRLRLRVPEDVAVVGVGNTLEGEQMTPSLSTVGPVDFFPRIAEVVRARATGEQTGPGELISFDWSLFVRDSSRTPTQTSTTGRKR